MAWRGGRPCEACILPARIIRDSNFEASRGRCAQCRTLLECIIVAGSVVAARAASRIFIRVRSAPVTGSLDVIIYVGLG